MWAWILVAAAGAYALHRLSLGYPSVRGRYAHLWPHEVAFLAAAAEATFPAGGVISLSGRDADLPGYVNRYFGYLRGRQKQQIRLLLLFFEQATLIFPAPGRLGRRRFSALDPAQCRAVLEAWSESRFFLRRLIFTALRAVLTMGYLGHPDALRSLRLSPLDFASPILEADLLYPRIGVHPDENPLGEADLTPRSDGTPLALDGPIHPDYAEKPL